MSFVKKIKDILFDEEEVTEPIKIRDENVEEVPKIVKIEPIREERKEVFKERTVEKEVVEEPKRVENSFQFPDFDEEEFVSSIKRPRETQNILDIEAKKSVPRRNEYKRIDRVEPRDMRDSRDNRELVDKKKFKPSPIISPVYGILNQDYRAEDIVKREDVSSNITIEEVRKKAFETPVREVQKQPLVEETIDEPVVTFFEEKDSLNNSNNEKVNYKSIDDLLEEASTEIPLEDTIEIPAANNLDAIEEELEKLDTEVKDDNSSEKNNLDDTLDSDLFELIDSMYDDREEAE